MKQRNCKRSALYHMKIKLLPGKGQLHPDKWEEK
jgi:hypothetical protein